MKAVLVILVTTFVCHGAEGTIANFLADKALGQISSWISVEGASWVTLPGHFEQGIVQGQTNNNYTFAMAGPEFTLDGSMSRVGEATLAEGVPDPNFETSQILSFTVSIKNVTVAYMHGAYNDDANGFYNISATATSDGVSAVLTINVKGSGDSCMGFANQATVQFNGNVQVATAGIQEAFPEVINAVSTHFKNNVPNSMGLLVQAATFSSLDSFDICTGVYNPLPEANIMATRLMNAMQDGLNKYIESWAEMPGFYRDDTDLNGTTMDRVVVRAGNFSSIGTLTRLGYAKYSNHGDSTTTFLNFTIETDKVNGVYDDILYTAASGIEYHLGEAVEGGRIRTSYSISFAQAPGAPRPSCAGGIQVVTSQYMTEDEVDLTLIGSDIPTNEFQALYDLVSQGFRDVINGEVEDLFIAAGKNAMTKVCR